MVTPYLPTRDGIATYAAQEVRRLVEEGHDVEVLSPGPSAAHHHLALRGWRGPLALAKRTRRYDRVIVQFQPDVFYPQPLAPRVRDAVTLGLMLAWSLTHVEVRIHEVNYTWGNEPGPSGLLFRMLWRAPRRIVVHTEEERRELCETMKLPLARVDVIQHGRNFVPRTTLDRNAARERLGIPADQFSFLTIGFIQPHKGFDRAVRAFGTAGLGENGCRLDVVGSVRVEERDFVVYRDELRAMVSETKGAHLHEGYVSDEMFDMWLVAADVVVLPYRFIFSSGVLERAALYERRVIATRVGGLEDQAGPLVTVVEDDAALARAMAKASGVGADASRRSAHAAEPWPVNGDGPIDRIRLQEEIRLRAEAGRLRHRHVPVGSSWTPSAEPREDKNPLRRIEPLERPNPASLRLSSYLVRRAVRKLTSWEVDPVVDQLNAVHEAAARAVDGKEI